MGTLMFGMSCTLDGYATDAAGDFSWGEPSRDAHAFMNARVRGTGTFVLGRRMFDTMRVWDTMPVDHDPVLAEFAELWKAADKIVCSDTLTSVDAPRTTLEPRLTVERLAEIVADARDGIEVSGPTTAAQALQAGLVDEVWLRVVPCVVGSGLRALPAGMESRFDLVESRTFDDGSVYLGYARATG
jgi:dihydrofolate reductase